MKAIYAAAALMVALGVAFFAGKHHERSAWEHEEAKAKLAQESRNVRLLDHFIDEKEKLADHYRRNPVVVRVRAPAGMPAEPRPECPAPRAEDIVLTLGGVKGRAAVSVR